MAKKSADANYKATVVATSGELTAKQKLQITDTTGAIQLIQATAENDIILKPAAWAEIDIHNEKSDDVDYKNFVIIDAEGKAYVTGSTTFWEAFRNIVDTMEGSGEDYEIHIFQKPSKNYNGKSFLTCSVM